MTNSGKSHFHPVDLKDAVVLITGGGRGIGAATALEFASMGSKVAITSRSEIELNAVAEKSKELGLKGQILPYVCDLSDPEQIKKTCRKIRRELGTIRVLVNNAGTIEVEKIEDVTLESFDRTFAVNVRGVFLCAQEVFSSLKESGKSGVILNVSSLSGIRGTQKFEGFCTYTASKHAVVGLTEAFAEEGKAYGIRVLCLAPGAVDTAMLKKAAPGLRTNTKPEEIAKLICTLCDDSKTHALQGSIIEVHSNG